MLDAQKAPKRIDPAASAESPAPGAIVPAPGASKWNAAGTWEEKGVSTWALDDLRLRLEAIKLSAAQLDERLPIHMRASSIKCTAETRTIKKLEGTCEITSSRGRTKRVFDFKIEVEFNVRLEIENVEVLKAKAEAAEAAEKEAAASAEKAAESAPDGASQVTMWDEASGATMPLSPMTPGSASGEAAPEGVVEEEVLTDEEDAATATPPVDVSAEGSEAAAEQEAPKGEDEAKDEAPKPPPVPPRVIIKMRPMLTFADVLPAPAGVEEAATYDYSMYYNKKQPPEERKARIADIVLALRGEVDEALAAFRAALHQKY